MSDGVAGESAEMRIATRDLYGAVCQSGGADLALSFESLPTNATPPTVAWNDTGDGFYATAFALNVSGAYTLQVTLGGQAISGMPLTRNIVAAAASAAGTTLVPQDSAAAAGQAGVGCRLILRDRFGNQPVYDPTAPQESFVATATTTSPCPSIIV